MAALLVGMLFVAGCSDPATRGQLGGGLRVYDGAPDPCGLLAVDEVKAATGHEVGAGRPTGTGHGCTFLEPGGGAGRPVASVLVETADDVDKMNGDRALAERQAVVSDLLVGDQGFSWVAGDTQSAEARRGSMRVRLLVEVRSPDAAATGLLTVAAQRAWWAQPG